MLDLWWCLCAQQGAGSSLSAFANQTRQPNTALEKWNHPGKVQPEATVLHNVGVTQPTILGSISHGLPIPPPQSTKCYDCWPPNYSSYATIFGVWGEQIYVILPPTESLWSSEKKLLGPSECSHMLPNPWFCHHLSFSIPCDPDPSLLLKISW